MVFQRLFFMSLGEIGYHIQARIITGIERINALRANEKKSDMGGTFNLDFDNIITPFFFFMGR